MQRPFKFSAGPATIAPEVLTQAAQEMLDWPDANGQRCGMGVMEMSHRGREFIAIYERAEADLRDLLAIPSQFKILFMQGGGLAENAIVPLNLCALRSADATNPKVDFVVTGSWSEKSLKEAGKYCQTHIAASNAAEGHTHIPAPASWQLLADASYLHLCTNETIHGVEYHSLPDLKALGSDATLVIDCSSHIASRPLDWSRVGLAFAGAQKNLGPAGLT
ncbi:MAG: aminotransferase class V-fold PLP-dependent enzyme, partial [Rhodoferax sp.]